MNTKRVLLKGTLAFIFFMMNFSLFAADFYWKANATDNKFTNPANWTGIGGSASPIGSDGQPRPYAGDNVFFEVVSNVTTIDCGIGNAAGRCFNVNVANALGSVFTFTNELNVFGNINSPSNKLILSSGSKIIFNGNGAKTILLTSSNLSNISFEFFGNGTYTLLGDLDSQGNSGSFNLHDDVQVNSNGNYLGLNGIKFTAPAGSASMNLDNSNVNLYEGIFFGEWNGTLAPGPGVSVTCVNTTLELCLIYNNSGNASLTGLDRILFRKGNFYPVVTGATNLEADTIYVNSNTFGAYNNVTADYFELLQPTQFSVNNTSQIKYNDFIVPASCSGSSSLNFNGAASSFSFENTSGSAKTIEMIFKNTNFIGSAVNSAVINDQGGNTGVINWTPSPPGLNFYWLGGGPDDDWNTPENWSVTGSLLSGGSAQTAAGCIPTLLDSVFFDGNHLSTNDVTNINSTNIFCKNIEWTSNTVKGIAGGVSQFYNWYVAGSANLSGMDPSVMARGYLYLIGDGVHTFNPPALYPRAIYFDGSGSYSILGDIEIVASSVSLVLHRNGVLNTNGFTITAKDFSSIPLGIGISRELFMDNSSFYVDNFGISSGLMTNFSAINSEIELTSSTSQLFVYDGWSAFGAPVTLTSMVLPKVSYTSLTGTPLSLYGSNVIEITELNVASNWDQRFGLIQVGTLNLTGGTNIAVTRLKITDTITVSGNTCGDIVSFVDGFNVPEGNLYKTTGTFNLDRAYLRNINASLGVPLTVSNGIDGGGNTNVTINSGSSRNFYWVTGTGSGSDGDYNDANHWSIGASGATYPTNLSTNPDGCLPTANDNVFFDNNSFNTFGQTVTITADANCKSMDWSLSGGDNPILAGTNIGALNVYESLTLSSGMTWSYVGTTNMLGSNLAANSQTIDFDGVTMDGKMRLSGGGRYDLLNDLSIDINAFGFADGSLSLISGEFYSNGYTISSTTMYILVNTATNLIDLSNSTVYTERFNIAHGAQTTNYSFVNTDIITSIPTSSISISGNSTYNYHTFTLAGVQLNTNATVNAQRVTQNSLNTNTTGNWAIDTLVLAKSSENNFQPGRTIVVNDTLVAFGTPCLPVILRSVGGIATYESTSLNTFIQFGSLQNMTASLAPPGASPTDYQVIGADVGGNTNWTFSAATALPYLGAYNVVEDCSSLPFGINTAGFSPISGSTYAWNTGSTAAAIDLDTAGIYSVEVTYAPNCVIIDSIDFSIVNTLDIQNIAITMPNCFEDTTGAIDNDVVGGNGDFDYYWTSPSGDSFTIDLADSTNASNLSAGTYQLIAVQENNRTCADTLSLTITEPTAIIPNLNVTNLDCNGDTDGEIAVDATGGTPAYETSIDGITFNAIPFTFTGLAQGSYDIIVRDGLGCLDTVTQLMNEPTALTASTTTTPVVCFGENNGSIDLTINGGTPTYDVSTDGGVTFVPANSNYSSLTAGSYEFIVEDQNGCRDTITQIVTEPTELLTTATITSNYNGNDVSCNGVQDGSISSTTNGGTVTYDYSWNTSPVETTPNLTGVGAGTYTLTVTDDNGCIAQSSVTLSEPTALNSTYVIDQDANCNVADGEATITTNGGTAAYTYAWSHNATITTNNATDLSAGVTSVTVTDANGCTENINISVNSINAPTPYLSANSVLCIGDNSGVAMVDSVVGNGGYTYSWTDGSGNPIAQINDTITGLTAGAYTVQVTDLNGCSGVETVTVNEPNSPVSINVINVTAPLCNSSDEGEISITASGGTGTISFEWNTNPIQTTADIFNLTEGSYTVTATDSNGCNVDETIQITAPTPLVVTSSQLDVACFNEASGEITLTTQGGTPEYSYAWSGITDTTNQITGLTAGNYSVVVSDSNNCTDTLTFVVNEPTQLDVELISSTLPECGSSNGVINIAPSGGVGTYSYVWNNGSLDQNNTEASSGLNSVIVTDQNGCTDSLETDLSCILFEIPEFLTPNDDGQNDTWTITGLENFQNSAVEIFNRWGTLVYTSDDYQNDWNGTSQSSLNFGGDQLPEGSYYYILTLGNAQDIENDGKIFKGYIYIKRN